MEYHGKQFSLYHGDCVKLSQQIPNDTIHLSVFSPPFANLYIYSDDLADMGNCKDQNEFFMQFDFLISQIYRITKPGRLCVVHCKQLPRYKGRDGAAGLYDFRGDVIRHFEACGWVYHSEVCIWKDPVIEMQRTKSHGLLYKQLRKDSSYSRQGLADYIVVFRKWAADYIDPEPVTHTKENFPLEIWQRYASPVWFDIRQTNVLNVQIAKDEKDEKHICPLQLDVIERSLELWSNEEDIVFDPFNGIGSTGYVALKMKRRYIGMELKEKYWRQSIENCKSVEQSIDAPTLFDFIREGL
jgi:DNA modification methylase